MKGRHAPLLHLLGTSHVIVSVNCLRKNGRTHPHNAVCGTAAIHKLSTASPHQNCKLGLCFRSCRVLGPCQMWTSTKTLKAWLQPCLPVRHRQSKREIFHQNRLRHLLKLSSRARREMQALQRQNPITPSTHVIAFATCMT